MQHGKSHDNRRFHHEETTTRRRADRAIDAEETLPPSEPAPAAKLEPFSEREQP